MEEGHPRGGLLPWQFYRESGGWAVHQHDFTPAEHSAAREAHAMESVLLSMRQMWFAASVTPFHCGLLVSEPDGELVTMVNGDGAQATRILEEARARRAYVVATPYSKPGDLAARLKRGGFHIIHRQGTYVYEGEPLEERDLLASSPAERKGLLRWFGTRKPMAVDIHSIGEVDLAEWNRVCWAAFSPRGVTEAQSMAEKKRAYRAMGHRAYWYLARHEGRPVATAILYQGDEAAQILAVGTLAAYRGRGAATALVRRAIYDWQRDGWGFLFLDTLPGGNAERLYLSLGFRQAYVRQVFAP